MHIFASASHRMYRSQFDTHPWGGECSVPAQNLQLLNHHILNKLNIDIEPLVLEEASELIFARYITSRNIFSPQHTHTHNLQFAVKLVELLSVQKIIHRISSIEIERNNIKFILIRLRVKLLDVPLE